MKNKVDINKLIEKKYKGNTLELSDILEEIDLVLNEVADYKTKIANPSDSIPENQESENIAYRMGQIGNRNPISGDLGRNPQYKQQVTADKIAETNSNLPTREVKFEIPVMDLFTMITNSKMEVDSEDRKLINDIVENMGASAAKTWRDRVKLLQKYSYELGILKGANKINISEAISNLIFLNLMKKLSFFTEDPGKQFEFLMAPLIAPNASVVPKDKKDIADVETTGGDKVSIKFFTADAPEVKGSIGGLAKYPNGLNYIVGKVFKPGIVEFGEAFLTCFINNIDLNIYKLERELSEGQILVFYSPNQIPTTKIYVKNREDQGELQKFAATQSKIQTTQKIRAPTPQSIQSSPTVAQDIKAQSANVGANIRNIQTYANTLNNDNLLNDKQFDRLMSVATDWSGKSDEFAKDFQKFKQFPEEEQRKNLVLQRAFFFILLNSLRARQQALLAAKKTTNENLNISEVGKTDSDSQFYFELSSGLWSMIKTDTLELGDPRKYNQQMLALSDGISKKYVEVLEGLRDLNRNLTSYFATSEQKQKERLKQKDASSQTGYAEKSIDSANKIINGVVEIEVSK